MSLDFFSISALVDEFLDVIAGGRIQDSVDVDQNAIGLEIYANRRRQYLYLSADNQRPRVHLVGEKLRRGLEKPSQLELLIRRKVEGGVISHISQPEWERILHIDIDGPEGPVTLIVEPMERRSNLLLVANGTILDCSRRVTPDQNRYRVSLPNQPYIPPPPQTGKLDPFQMTFERWLGIFDQATETDKKLSQILSSRILGLSPLLSKEIVFRAGMTNVAFQDADPTALYEHLQTVFEPLRQREWQAGVGFRNDAPVALSVVPLKSVPEWKPYASISEACSVFYGAPIGEDAYAAGKKSLFEAIEEGKHKARGKLASLQKSMTDDSERELLRQSGELILAYQYSIQPKQTELRAQYDFDQPELVIALDPKQTPLENAQSYFEKYNKAQRALEDVPQKIAETQTEINFLEQLAVDLELATNYPEIDEVRNALRDIGTLRDKPAHKSRNSSKSAPLRYITPDGFIIWVGRNSRQNELVTFDKGGPQDIWLHVRGVPGAHVIIKVDGRPIPDAVMVKAAQFAAHYSAHRNDANVIVDYTYRRHVRKIKGAGPGQVTYRNEETITVTPSSDSELK